LVGRDAELAAIAAVLDAARSGSGAQLCFVGAAGIGKTSLLDAAEADADGFTVLRTTGVPSELLLRHAALADIVTPLRDCTPELPPAQRAALDMAMGWSAQFSPGGPFLVGAATVSLLSAAATRGPVLVLVDDLQWIDPESLGILLFAVRRLRRDAVAVVLARRAQSPEPDLTGIDQRRLSGLSVTDSAALLPHRAASAAVVARLVTETGGNPLALLEAVRRLTPAQLRGSAPLPAVLPVGQRLTDALLGDGPALSADAGRAVIIAAAALDDAADPILTAVRAAGIDADAALREAELAGAVRLDGGTLTFRHPLLRSAVWQRATPAERRSAHAALAAALQGRPAQAVRHRAEAAIGFDDDLAQQLIALAAEERSRLGYAASSSLLERAAQLSSSAQVAADALASAVEDAVLGGDVQRAHAYAATFDGRASSASDQARARVLFALGTLEENRGSVPRSRGLLRRAVEIADGTLRLQALVELGQVHYLLGSPGGAADVADMLGPTSVLVDPEQEMLAAYLRAAALAFSGRWEQAHPFAVRALELLETVPALQDEPRYLVLAMLSVGWAREPDAALTFVDRRLAGVRARGAIGVLPMALDIYAAGALMLGRHDIAYAAAGEVVELGGELGYVSAVSSANATFAIECAARGRDDEATHAIAEAERLVTLAGLSGSAVQIHLAEAFCALCRGDHPAVIGILEQRLAADEGRLPRGDYPLSVAADLVEAYLAVGRRDDALSLAARHSALHRESPIADIRALDERITAMTTDDDDAAETAFQHAHDLHAQSPDPFPGARTRLLHGSRLRRTGSRIAARQQLRVAADAFRTMGLDRWTERAEAELAATGATARRTPTAGDPLTAQETRVALLVAEGRTNRDIASVLFLSPKTVEHHVTTILRKRGLRSRTELAVAFALPD
jgi:DNA-binding CsgD family transcriptional regulator